ncbi:hypothetical protein FM996_07370 [Methylosinus sporium]|uniref:IucA/IucC family protein n=1 Tax=Methylosinus sporium TaxID=428 RepID=A0A549T121_METSR|nr:IucA/IucC family protein [Methylosinus sporium]TRL35551.1 hypothetical protein FM996_07370 [Methylosinus sporium]
MTIDKTSTAIWSRLEFNRLIDTWLRERHPELTARMAERVGGSAGIAWEIPVGHQAVLAVCTRYSPGGFHAWDGVLLRGSDGRTHDIAPGDLAGLMLDSFDGGTPDTRRLVSERVNQSIESSCRHAAFRSKQEPASTGARAERSLWFGHPFHPLAKSVVGFTSADFESYSPERNAAFQLCWLLAEPDIVVSYICTPESMARADALLMEASRLGATEIAGRTLIPCHPWQAARLREHPHFRDHLASGALSLLGPSGEFATPTSSVRTVWFEKRGLYVKLPLEARITNFSRVNSAEQLARSIAGARAIAAAEEQVRAAGLTILEESGGRILRRAATDDAQQTCPETGFLLRSADFDEGVDPIVVAGFVEPNPRTGRPNLSAISGGIFDERQRTLEWVERYTEIVLLPLVRLLATTGVCLEAHAQNSLVAFDEGWPSRLFVRDLEGVAVDRECFAQAHPRIVTDLDDALFYEREVIWRRFLYYVIVNHFAHVLSAVAELADVDEARLWAASRYALETHVGPADTIIARLLSAPSLPAKANLTSCVVGRGENPDYVMIANPFVAGRSPVSLGRIQLRGASS